MKLITTLLKPLQGKKVEEWRRQWKIELIEGENLDWEELTI